MGTHSGKSEMKPDLKLFAIAIFLIAIPILMALPQSFLLSDVVLSQDAPSRQHTSGEEGRMPLFGKITAIHNSSFEISNPNGETVTVKLTPQTEFRKDREAAKRSDFKVGDVIAVRGEVKSVDAPKISVVRSDNVTQTIELNEDTARLNGRDAIIMADVPPAVHVL